MSFTAFGSKAKTTTVDEVLETFTTTLTKLEQITNQREESIASKSKQINDLQEQIDLDEAEATRAKSVFEKLSNLLK